MARGNSRTLTDAGIRKIAKPAPGKRLEIFDALAPGLALRITDKGARSWTCYYRWAGKNQRVRLGAFPEISIADARDKARDAKDQAKAGIDPRVALTAAAAPSTPRTFGPLAEAYIKREVPRLARGSEIESLIRRQILRDWKDRVVDDLRKRDAIKLTDKLVDDGKSAAAYRLYETIKRLFSWFEERDELDVNPMAGLKPPSKKVRRQRTLTDPEIKVVWNAAEAIAYPFGRLVQILLLTGQRRDECASMRWREIDLNNGVWLIPEERTKSRRPQLVPLSKAAVDVLRALPRFDGDEDHDPEHDFVFTTTGGRRPVSGFSKMRSRFDEKCKVAGWVLHDLRRTCRTNLARLGVPEIVAERVIGHGPKGLVAVYDLHGYETEKRDALDRWARHIDLILNPPPKNVVELRQAAE